MKTIEAINVSKYFENEKVFSRLDFSVEKGEVVVIIGPSGEGKSTFLRCLIGLEMISSGIIKLDGEEIIKDGRYVSADRKKRLTKKVGMVFQNFNLFDNMTVLKNLELACKIKGNENEVRAKSNALIKRFKLEGKEDMYPKKLSGGQKQRVAIARALMLDPEIIFFDEPTSALDPETSNEVALIINELSGKGYTILIVTHDMDFARKIKGKIVLMKDNSLKNIELD